MAICWATESEFCHVIIFTAKNFYSYYVVIKFSHLKKVLLEIYLAKMIKVAYYLITILNCC